MQRNAVLFAGQTGGPSVPAGLESYANLIGSFKGAQRGYPGAVEGFEREIASSQNPGVRPGSFIYRIKDGKAIHSGTVIGAITYGKGSERQGVIIGGDRQTSLGEQWAYVNNTKKVHPYGKFAVASTGLVSAIDVAHFIIADAARRYADEFNSESKGNNDRVLMDVTRAAGLLYCLGNTEIGEDAGHLVAGVSNEGVPLVYDIDGPYMEAHTSHFMKGSGSVFATAVLDNFAAKNKKRTEEDAIRGLVEALFAGTNRDNFCSAKNDDFQLLALTADGITEVPEDTVVAIASEIRKAHKEEN